MDELGASDIHLYPGAPPVFRIDNHTCPTGRFAPISQQQIERLIHELAPDAAWEEFLSEQQCSFNYRQVDMAHSRVSAFVKSGVPHCTIRYLPEEIPSFEDLHIPRKTMERLAGSPRGVDSRQRHDGEREIDDGRVADRLDQRKPSASTS